MVDAIEITAILHGFLGTVFLMAFAGALAELIELTHAGINRLKIGTVLMLASVTLTDIIGDLIYTIYRSPTVTSAKSQILAGSSPWAHTILMELKEHIAHFVPLILAVVVFAVYYFGEEITENKELKQVLASLLVLAMLITLLVFGLGAYITKVKAI